MYPFEFINGNMDNSNVKKILVLKILKKWYNLNITMDDVIVFWAILNSDLILITDLIVALWLHNRMSLFWILPTT